MKIEIKSRFDAKILFECEAETIKDALEKAIKSGADLRGANLRGANLRGANLRGANLYDANLRGANLYGADLYGANLYDANLYGADLRGANLRGANLRGADLYGANLRGADLRGADLYDANLYGADLYGANLRGANLRGANLRGANLRGANLRGVKEDYFKVLSIAKNEVSDLYKSLMEGKINGSTYEGECACLVGTVAKIRNEPHEGLSIDLKPDSSRPAERWFMNISRGDTPQNNQCADIVKIWTEEFMKANEIKIPQISISWI